MDANNKITEHINSYTDWRGDLLSELRELINEAPLGLQEDFKWGVPVWTSNGLVCAVSGFKDHVKMNFFKGALLDDPKKVFNSGLDSKEHRSINFSRGDKVDKTAILNLLHAAVAYNSK